MEFFCLFLIHWPAGVEFHRPNTVHQYMFLLVILASGRGGKEKTPLAIEHLPLEYEDLALCWLDLTAPALGLSKAPKIRNP